MTNSRRSFMKNAGSAGLMTAGLGLGLAGLTACATPAQRVTEDHFGLNPSLNGITLPDGMKIGIDRVNVNGIFAGRPIIEQVSTSPVKYQETRSKLWHASPADLIRDAVIAGWNNAAGRTVAVSTQTERPDLKLEMDLLTIGHDAAGAGFVTMRARVITNQRKVILDQSFAATGPASSELNGSVLSIESALAIVINDIATAISASL